MYDFNLIYWDKIWTIDLYLMVLELSNVCICSKMNAGKNECMESESFWNKIEFWFFIYVLGFNLVRYIKKITFIPNCIFRLNWYKASKEAININMNKQGQEVAAVLVRINMYDIPQKSMQRGAHHKMFQSIKPHTEPLLMLHQMHSNFLLCLCCFNNYQQDKT